VPMIWSGGAYQTSKNEKFPGARAGKQRSPDAKGGQRAASHRP
jgi:hypothetical protein